MNTERPSIVIVRFFEQTYIHTQEQIFGFTVQDTGEKEVDEIFDHWSTQQEFKSEFPTRQAFMDYFFKNSLYASWRSRGHPVSFIGIDQIFTH